MNERIDISINGNEKSKNEIVYNNVMNNLSEKEKVKYLQSKVTTLELEMKNRLVALILILCTIVGFSIGIYFLALDLFVLGTVVIFLTFITVMIRFYMMYKAILKVTHNMEFDKIEQLKRSIDKRLK